MSIDPMVGEILKDKQKTIINSYDRTNTKLKKIAMKKIPKYQEQGCGSAKLNLVNANPDPGQ